MTSDEPSNINPSAGETIVNELNARTGDLRRLNELFYRPLSEVKESDTETSGDVRHNLLDQVISRNNDFLFSLQKVGSPQLFPDQGNLQQVVSANQQWQDEIYKMAHIVAFVKKEMLTEMKDRTEDLQTVISVLKCEKPTAELERIVLKNKERHDAIQQALVELNTLIVESDRNRQEPNTDAPTTLPNAETPVVEEKAVANEMQSLLGQENKSWEDSIQELQKVPTRVPSSAVGGDFAPALTQMLIDELTSRVTDLETLSALKNQSNNNNNENDNAPQEVLASNAQKRHERMAQGLTQVLQGGDQNESEKNSRQELFTGIEKDNKRWEESLKTQEDAVNNSNRLWTQRDFARQEMQGRIDDLQKLRNLHKRNTEQKMEEEKLVEEVNQMVQTMMDRHKEIESKIEGNLTQKDLEESIKIFVATETLVAKDANETKVAENPPSVKTDNAYLTGLPPPDDAKPAGLPPPDDVEPAGLPPPDHVEPAGLPPPDHVEEPKAAVTMEEVMRTPFQVYQQNDTEWRNAFREMIRELLGVEPPPDEEPIPEWWLDRDAERRAHVHEIIVRDNFKVNEEPSQSGTIAEVKIVNESEDLKAGATYMERVLVRPVEDQMRRLYIPMKLNDEEKLDNYHILATVYDGAMLGYLLDTAQPDFLDVRVIHLPNVEEPLPLESHQVEDNVQLVLSSAKALGIRLPSYDPKDWMNIEKNVPIFLALIKELCGRNLQRYINVNKHPELIRLAADNEDSEAIGDLTPYDWIPRWMNRSQKRPLNKAIEDFNLEMFNTMSEIDNDFLSKAPVKKYAENPEAACAFMIDYAVNQLGVQTNIQKEDLLANNQLLQDLFAAQVFDTKSGLAKLTKKEQNRFQSIHLDTNIQTADESMCNFINSLLPSNLMIHNLKKDLSDGVVICKILDRVMPGCIDWTKIRDKDKIRHKFDKMNNCKQAMEAATRDLNLKMVNAGGQDLHDGNQKIIHSLLWQVMRYQAMKTLSSLSFEGRQIEEKDILDWCNQTLTQIDPSVRRSEPLQGFKDRPLTTCVPYIELLKVLLPGAVKDDIVFWDVVPLHDLRKREDDEEMYRKRLSNAKYAMTLARREGAELFVLPEDLIALETKAVLSMMASLMTISFQEKQSQRKQRTEVNEDEAKENDIEATLGGNLSG